jgi:hypothetical protein
MKSINSIGLLSAMLLLVGCATVNSVKAPDADLTKLKTYYVARLPADERGIEKLIASRLESMGHPSTSGDAQTPPAKVDAVLTYQDRWMWDITMYMIRLDIQIRDGQSGAILATGQVMRPSMQRKSPEGMVEEVLKETIK